MKPQRGIEIAIDFPRLIRRGPIESHNERSPLALEASAFRV